MVQSRVVDRTTDVGDLQFREALGEQRYKALCSRILGSHSYRDRIPHEEHLWVRSCCGWQQKKEGECPENQSAHAS